MKRPLIGTLSGWSFLVLNSCILPDYDGGVPAANIGGSGTFGTTGGARTGSANTTGGRGAGGISGTLTGLNVGGVITTGGSFAGSSLFSGGSIGVGGTTSNGGTTLASSTKSAVGGSITANGGSAVGGLGATSSGGASATTGGATTIGGSIQGAGGDQTGTGGGPTGGTLAIGGTPTGGALATGGALTGGTLAIGGTPTGGTLATGGTPTGGTLATGGTPTGGALATGGTPTGGTLATGGTPTGGTLATGGTPTGGALATGGTPTGGTLATGGTGCNNTSTGGSGIADCTPGYSGTCIKGWHLTFAGNLATSPTNSSATNNLWLWPIGSGTLIGYATNFNEGGRVVSLGAVAGIPSGPTSGTFRLAIYTSVNSGPGTLVAETGDVTSVGIVNSCSNNRPVIQDLTQPWTIVPGSDYWIMLLVGPDPVTFVAQDSGGRNNNIRCGDGFGAWPSQPGLASGSGCVPASDPALGIAIQIFAVLEST